MRETKVKSLVVIARRKRYYTGETVQESWFPGGEFDRLIKAGHLHPVGEEPKEAPKEENNALNVPAGQPVTIKSEPGTGNTIIEKVKEIE